MTPSAAVTVLVPTSASPTHPDTAIIATCIDSIRQQLPHAETLILIDGVPDSHTHLRRQYEDYQRKLFDHCRHDWHGVTPIRHDHHTHQAAMTLNALTHVRTPLVAFIEHDWQLHGTIPWAEMGQAILADEADLIRLSWEPQIEPHHRHLYADQPEHVAGIPLIRTRQWSQRPHLASADYYRRILATLGPSRVMIEDVLAGVVPHAYRERGHRAWNSHRLYLYHPDDDIGRCTHLDGRRDEAPVESWLEYDGPAPAGAPHASVAP